MEKARTRWFGTTSGGSARVARQRLKNDLLHAPRTQTRQPATPRAARHAAPESSSAQNDLLHALLAREIGA
jgi:hypothetical protein